MEDVSELPIVQVSPLVNWVPDDLDDTNQTRRLEEVVLALLAHLVHCGDKQRSVVSGTLKLEAQLSGQKIQKKEDIPRSGQQIISQRFACRRERELRD
jgi:hypothetical protein